MCAWQHEIQLATYRESDAAADDPTYGFSPWGAPLLGLPYRPCIRLITFSIASQMHF